MRQRRFDPFSPGLQASPADSQTPFLALQTCVFVTFCTNKRIWMSDQTTERPTSVAVARTENYTTRISGCAGFI